MYSIIKRLLDLAIASVLLVIFLPVWLIVPILIKIDSPGPVFFKHRRVGKGGIPFDMYKFRSMVNNAHEYLHHQDPELLKKFKDNDWKLEHDPRITKVGKILRSVTIDEFPQLLNVLRGEMSMVGPRAYMKAEIKEQTIKYPQTQALMEKVLTVKPGITGPWQVSGRNVLRFDKRVVLDAQYAKKQNLSLDMAILFKTPAAMFSKW